MEKSSGSQHYDSVFSKKIKAGRRRTYFFDVKKTRGEDFYITLTESTKKFQGEGYQRHKLFLYKEDFNRFLEALTETIDHIKAELLPDYDFDEYSRRSQEWEQQKLAESQENSAPTGEVETRENDPARETSEDEMEW